ncbi:tetratricopeptide repeat protein [Bacteroidota bacterium]
MKQVLIAFLFFSISAATAQPIEQTDADRQISFQLFNGNWLKADTLIDLEIQKNPNHPKYYFFKAHNYFYGRFTSTDGPARDVTIRAVIHNCWKAIEIGEELPQTTEIKFYLGNAYGMLARANILAREYWTAYWNSGKCEDYLEDVIEEDPECYDAYLNHGIQEYFPDAMLEGFRYFMAWLGGASGDKETGLEYITKAAENGKLLKDEAIYALAFIYWIGERNPSKSLLYFEEITQIYPASERTNYFHKQMSFTNTVLEKGTYFLIAERDSLIEKYDVTSPYMLNNAAYQLTEEERFEEALTVYELNYELFPNSSYPARALGTYYTNAENDEKAIEYYKISFNKVDADTLYSEPVKIRVKDVLRESLDELGADIEGL